MGKRLFLILNMIACIFLGISAAGNRFTLVIDAGHGGHDAGAKGAFSMEKAINLNVALAFGRYVERNCPDVRVIYTRKTDVFVPLHERANIANRNKADLFVSIHTNALPGGKTARGLETYTLGMHRAADNLDVAKRENSVILVEKDYKQHYEGFDPNSAESYIMFEFLQDRNMAKSVDLAKMVQRRTCATANRPDKGVKQAGFLVLRETSMPSCLIELGFITTRDEEQFLNTPTNVDALGKGIYQAFADYKQKYDRSITIPYQAETKQQINIPSIVPESEKTTKSKRVTKKRTTKSIIEELSNARNQAQDKNGNTIDTVAQQQNSKTENKDTVKPLQSEKIVEPVRHVDFTRPIKKVQTTRTTNNNNRPQASTRAITSTSVPTLSSDTQGKSDAPIFKVQILTSSRQLRPGSQQFKGIEDVDSYQENGLIKYTSGASTNYNEIYRLRKSLLEKFPEAFIIAFKNGEKMNVVEAIKEFKQNRNK